MNSIFRIIATAAPVHQNRMTVIGVLVVILLAQARCSSSTQLEDPQLRDHECPTWFNPSSNNDTKCECGKNISEYTKCDQTSKQVRLRISACMTYDNTTGNTLLSKECHFSDLERSGGIESDYVLLPKDTSELNEFMCGKLNRVGLMCHKCKPGYGPAVLSYEGKCIKCFSTPNGVLLYFLIACLPTTLLFLIMVSFQIRIITASLNAIVFYIQCFYFSAVRLPQISLGSPGISHAVNLAFVTLCGFWNLDFFRFLIPPFCISDRLTNLHVLTMEYLVALFPLFLTALTYIIIQLHARDCRVFVYLWRPFSICFAPLARRYQWNPIESMVHVFVTFLLLSYSKVLFVSLNLLMPSQLYNSTGAVVGPTVLYYDASVGFFSHEHLPFALLAIAVLLTFNILPLLVVVLYPTRVFQKCLNCCRIRWHAVHAFADAFNGCYKDGTNGTWDYRYFAGFYLLLRIIYLIRYTGDQQIVSWTSIFALLLFALCRPYKTNLFNILDSIWILLYLLTLQGFHIFDPVGAIVLVSYFIMYILSKILLKVQCRCFLNLKSFVDRVTDEQNIQTNREDGQGGDLPDRLVNPEGYRLLSEPPTERGDYNSCENNSHVPTYGIM